MKSILLFGGVPKVKDSMGTSAYDRNGIVQRAIELAKDQTDLVVAADLCLCEYTDHGHCGIVRGGNEVDNDMTLDIYRKIAATYAEAGADIIAPSGMMDGQVAAIRETLTDSGFKDTLIMAYSAKMASSMYSPFRNAAESRPRFGDRRSYQMPYGNLREAMREIDEDVRKGQT